MLKVVDKQVILVFKQVVIVETHIRNIFASFFTILVLFHEHL